MHTLTFCFCIFIFFKSWMYANFLIENYQQIQLQKIKHWKILCLLFSVLNVYHKRHVLKHNHQCILLRVGMFMGWLLMGLHSLYWRLWPFYKVWMKLALVPFLSMYPFCNTDMLLISSRECDKKHHHVSRNQISNLK